MRIRASAGGSTLVLKETGCLALVLQRFPTGLMSRDALLSNTA